MIEVASQASEDVSYAFPGDESPLAGAKRAKQQKSILANRFSQVSKNKDMKRYLSSPVLPSVSQTNRNEKRGFHKFQDELAKLKLPKNVPSDNSSIYLTSKTSQANQDSLECTLEGMLLLAMKSIRYAFAIFLGSENANCAKDYMDQFYSESLPDMDDLIFCTQQAEQNAKVEKNAKVNPTTDLNLTCIPSTNDSNDSTKLPITASSLKPVISNIDSYFDDSFSGILSSMNDIIEQAGNKVCENETPVKSTTLLTKTNVSLNSTLTSTNIAGAMGTSGFPRHVSMPLKKDIVPAKNQVNNNMERHSSLNFNQQLPKSNNIKDYNSTESIQSSGKALNNYIYNNNCFAKL